MTPRLPYATPHPQPWWKFTVMSEIVSAWICRKNTTFHLPSNLMTWNLKNITNFKLLFFADYRCWCPSLIQLELLVTWCLPPWAVPLLTVRPASFLNGNFWDYTWHSILNLEEFSGFIWILIWQRVYKLILKGRICRLKKNGQKNQLILNLKNRQNFQYKQITKFRFFN